MAILSFQKNAGSRAGIVHREHDDRAGVLDDVPPRPHASGFLDVVGSDGEDRTAVYRLGGDEALFGSFVADGFGGRFGHEDNIKHGFRLWVSALRTVVGRGMPSSGSRIGEARSRFCYAARHGSKDAGRDCWRGEFRGGPGSVASTSGLSH